MSDRVVKVALPVDLIKRMDQAIVDGRGGLETRAEFIREATENFLTEISYPEAPPEPALRARETKVHPSDEPGGPSRPVESSSLLPGKVLDEIPAWEREELRLADLAGTALGRIEPGATLDQGVAQPHEEPLLGLHNRDYPSLWVAARLARYSQDGLLPFSDFCRRATNAAWLFASSLAPLEEAHPGIRLRALFPSNPDKRQAAESGFQTFAIGSIPRKAPSQGSIPADGPLFVWRLCQLEREGDRLLVGLTRAGRSLLEDLDGISLDFPHDAEAATRFLTWVSEVSPGEKWGFDHVLAAVAERPDREQLVGRLAEQKPDWTPSTVSSVTQGYVARAREWGLIEQRLEENRYRLTEFGESRLA